MNRLKLWLYVLVVIGVGAAALHLVTADLRAGALHQLDGRLATGAARLGAAQRALQAEASGVAALAARDPALLQALVPSAAPAKPRGASPAAPEPTARAAALDDAAAAALAAAQAELGASLPGARAIAADAAELERRAAEPSADADVIAALREALGRKARRAFVRAQGGVAWAAAVPAGEAGALAVVVPLDAAWLRGVAAGSGIDLTLVAPGAKLASSAPAGAEALAAAAARGGAGREGDAGKLAPVKVEVFGVDAGAHGFLVGSAPAHRVLAVPVAGVKDAGVVVSAQAAPVLAPVVRLQWNGAALLAVLLVVGLLFGVLVRSAEPAPDVPADLLAAADRIGRGDFAARAPAMAGKLGTLSAALNRATEAAAAAGRGPAPSLTQEFFAAPAPAPEPESFQLPPRPPPAPVPGPGIGSTLRLDASALQGGAFEAAPVPAAPARPPPVIAPEPPQAVPADLLQAAARAAPAEPASDEEHWREVFRDFLRVRGECGESVEGLTYERFRQKLEQNRASLVTKYGCRTVRFQVYVKEGKTALKATPVR